MVAVCKTVYWSTDWWLPGSVNNMPRSTLSSTWCYRCCRGKIIQLLFPVMLTMWALVWITVS